MKNNILNKVLLTGVTLLAPTIVSAESANVAIVGENTAYANDTITLNVKVNNIDDADIVAVGGDILYNPEYLTLIDTKSLSTNYSFDGNKISDGNYRIAGVDFTMENGIKSETAIYSLVFKANKVGQTMVSFKNEELVNTNAKVISSTTSSKVLNIKEKEVANEEVKAVNTNNEVKQEVKEVKNDIVKTNNNINNVVNSTIVNKEVVINNTNVKEVNKIAIFDRLNPVKFDKDIKGLTINDVMIYSIYNFMKER